MGDVQGFFVPAAPRNVAIRPLDKGMILNQPSTLLPVGSVVTAKNLWIIDSVLKRRPGLSPYMSLAAMSYPVRGATSLWSVGGIIYNVHWDKSYVYGAITSSFLPKYWKYTNGTVRYTSGKMTVMGSSTAWTTPTNMVRAGDVISITGLGRYTVNVVQASNQLILYTTFGTTGGLTTYAIRRTFKNTASRLTDYCVADNKVIFADGGRPLYSYDGTTFTRYISTPVGTTYDWKPYCVAYFANRIWTANTIEGSTYRRQRIRWSQVTDHQDFNDAAGTDTQWLDLPYSAGEIKKLMPLGNMLIAYLDDCIYYGIQTNIPTLPISFQKLETGGIGLVGNKAITSFMGVHYWIGQDDIYALSSKGVERIGTAVVRDTIRTCTDRTFCQVAVDPINDRVVFGFPESSTNMTRLWSYFYKNQAWTYDEIAASSIDFVWNSTNVTWDNFANYSSDGYWSGLTFGAWDAIMATSGSIGNLIIGRTNGRVVSFSTDGTVDNMDGSSAPIPVILESGDFDLDMPDDEKCWLRLTIKLRDIATENIDFTVSVNQFRDRSTTWKNVGTLRIASGDDEGYVTFRLTSSHMRFKLEGVGTVGPYDIQEAILRVRIAGQESKRVAS